MTGEAGRIVTVEQSIVPTSATYFYGPFGLSEIKEKRQESPQQWSEGTSTLSYDARGRLNEVRKSFLIFDRFPTNWNQTAKIEVESQGRLLRARIVTCSTSPANSFCTESSTARTYDLAGFVTSAGTTTYSVDADGWLVSREESGALDTSPSLAPAETWSRSSSLKPIQACSTGAAVRSWSATNGDGYRSNRCSRRVP